MDWFLISLIIAIAGLAIVVVLTSQTSTLPFWMLTAKSCQTLLLRNAECR